MSDKPFFGYIVWNKKRNAMVLDHDSTAFVWDDQAIAEDHMRADEPDDEVRYVEIKMLHTVSN